MHKLITYPLLQTLIGLVTAWKANYRQELPLRVFFLHLSFSANYFLGTGEARLDLRHASQKRRSL